MSIGLLPTVASPSAPNAPRLTGILQAGYAPLAASFAQQESLLVGSNGRLQDNNRPGGGCDADGN